MNASIVNAMFFHPTKYATILGPKSLAGLSPASVIGPIVHIKAATVRPINNGNKSSLGLPMLQPSVIEKIIITKMKTPRASANAATGILITPFAVLGNTSIQILDAGEATSIVKLAASKLFFTESEKNTHNALADKIAPTN